MKTPHVGLSRLEPARVPLKEESGDLGEERLPDGEQLLRDDREHLDVDPVELVEARLNSSRHVQQPVCATPEKSLPIIL